MRTIKFIAILVSLIFLTTSCYTQLALVEHDRYDQQYSGEDYYYQQKSDTLYSDEAPSIIQNFYYDNPYYSPYSPYNFSFNVGFYDNWWWNDFYFTGWPYVGFYPIRPFLLYPIIGIYDPFYDPYYDPWWYGYGPVFSKPYGPRPFTKGGSLVRGGGSKRVRISSTTGGTGWGGSSSFIPTRASGSAGAAHPSRAIRKRATSDKTSGRITGRAIRRETTRRNSSATIERGATSQGHRTIVIRRRSTGGRHYYPITGSSTQPRHIVKQTTPKQAPKLKRSTIRKSNQGSYRSNRWTPPSRSTYSGRSRSSSYSTPSRSASFHRTTTIRSSSVSRSSSTHSSGTRRAVRKK